MTISRLLAPIPKWVIMNNDGTAAGGAKLYTYSSLNPSQPKKVYQDPGGLNEYSNPIIFDANGTEGPFYWEVDSDNFSDNYFLQAYDSNDNLLWAITDYFPPGEGGGGNVNNYVSLTNLIQNNVFYNHYDDLAGPLTINQLISPSNNQGFTPDIVPVTPSPGFGTVGPDIRFVKSNTNAVDSITFNKFTLGTQNFGMDVTPISYIRYNCTNSPSPAETFKCFNFPITQGVQNLSNTQVTFVVWAKVASGTADLKVYSMQYFGSGSSASAPVRSSGQTISLDTTWTKYTSTFTIPTASTKTLSICNDDALYIQLEMPLGSICDVWFTKPALYVGTLNPDYDYDTFDKNNFDIQLARPGEKREMYSSRIPAGWLRLNDGTIAKTGVVGATARANDDTFCLYKTLWDSISDTYCPVSTGRGSTAVEDFIAGKTLRLPLTLGYAAGAAGDGSGLTSRALGESSGSETHTLTFVELPTILSRTARRYVKLVNGNAPAEGLNLILSDDDPRGNHNGILNNVEGGHPHTNMQPTSFSNWFIKL